MDGIHDLGGKQGFGKVPGPGMALTNWTPTVFAASALTNAMGR